MKKLLLYFFMLNFLNSIQCVNGKNIFSEKTGIFDRGVDTRYAYNKQLVGIAKKHANVLKLKDWTDNFKENPDNVAKWISEKFFKIVGALSFKSKNK